MHANQQPPVGIRISPGASIAAGHVNYGGTMPEPGLETAESLPFEGRCPRWSVCSVSLEGHSSAAVFAFDPVVEVELSPPRPPWPYPTVRYYDAASGSAALGKILETSLDLVMACSDHRVERARRLERGAQIEAELRQLADEEPRDVVRRAAWLALVQGQCTEAPENRAIAERLLGELEPNAPELALWTDALRRLGKLAGDPERGEALIDAVIDQHPRPAVGARVLALRLRSLADDADPRLRDAIERRLFAPPFASTLSAVVAKQFGRNRNALHLAPGDPLPGLELAGVDGTDIGTDSRAPNGLPRGAERRQRRFWQGERPKACRAHVERRTTQPESAGAVFCGVGQPVRCSSGQRQLVYFSASWCGGCIESLPELRRLASKHPDLRVVYVLWDLLPDAQRFCEEQSPVPGEAAWLDVDARKRVRPKVFEYVALPSFVLADADGTVLATSDETKLETLDEVLAR